MKKILITIAIIFLSNYARADSFLDIGELPVIDPDSRGPCYYFKENTYNEITADVIDEDSNENKKYFQLDGKTIILKGEYDDNNDPYSPLTAFKYKYKNYVLTLSQIKIINDKQILNKLIIKGNGKIKKINIIQFCPNSFG